MIKGVLTVPETFGKRTTKTRRGKIMKRKPLLAKEEMNEINMKAILEDDVSHPFESLSSKIIGAAIEVHAALGPGFLESIYEEALKLELRECGLNYECQKEIKVE
jgi:hypothetical protein